MPELPEVETVRRGLAKHLVGRRIESVKVQRGDLRRPLPEHFAETLTGRRLETLERRAKYLLFHFDKQLSLMAHLGMSGSMVLQTGVPRALRKHDHVVMQWSGGITMSFHDPRRFGLMIVGTNQDIMQHPLLKSLGPEPFDKAVNADWMHAVLKKSASPVKTVIMDQRKLVGVGNIYACEALFQAKIHPERLASAVTLKEAGALCLAIKAVLKSAIASGGSTLRDYVRSTGDGGYFQHHFNVYGREGKSCHICGNVIMRLQQAGRSTFFCAHCQK